MSRFRKDSKFRLRDYLKRNGNNVCYTHEKLKMEYLPIHEFENNVIDAYWNQVSDICFIQVEAVESNEEVGLFARWPSDKQMYLNLVSRVKSTKVSRAVFEAEMEKFIDKKYVASEELRRKLGTNLVEI